jgi:hypothetical protein
VKVDSGSLVPASVFLGALQHAMRIDTSGL